jgi:hypothetical protein
MTMRTLAKIISYLALVVLIVPSFLLFAGKMDLDACKIWMFAATVVWFVTAPFWMDRKAQ